MKFSIITPTFKRQELLSRAVASLQAQTYKDWEMIIVNDSPKDTAYHDFTSSVNDSRIHYFVNEINRGVNYRETLLLKDFPRTLVGLFFLMMMIIFLLTRWPIFLNVLCFTEIQDGLSLIALLKMAHP